MDVNEKVFMNQILNLYMCQYPKFIEFLVNAQIKILYLKKIVRLLNLLNCVKQYVNTYEPKYKFKKTRKKRRRKIF